jgi:hypothetical protein
MTKIRTVALEQLKKQYNVAILVSLVIIDNKDYIDLQVEMVEGTYSLKEQAAL